ncbi:uncharacterized protein LOC115730311 [Rhodamnia argentea]|uniref:Uncharacterized protein LOC115730311 n=1 Tax=Rhodamnia argentea TaxID=178133 RepID=A0A8B8N326_9MYRT|nr:uncharacterized protein LOC115730311 [Rhodamnia argentea]
MSLQLRQPPPPLLPPPQPVLVYPNTFARPPPSQQHSHSSGSFGKVFLVLAIVLAVSAIACFFGRFCGRRSRSSDPSAKQNRQTRPGGHDVEFGVNGRNRGAADPTAGNVGGSKATEADKDKAGLGGG